MGVRPKTEGGAGAAPPTVAAAPNGVNDDDGMNDAGVKAGCEGLWEGEGKKRKLYKLCGGSKADTGERSRGRIRGSDAGESCGRRRLVLTWKPPLAGR